MKLIKNKKTEKENKSPLDYYFGKPRIEMAGSEITFWGDDLKINSFTREGAVVQGNITSMEFSS